MNDTVDLMRRETQVASCKYSKLKVVHSFLHFSVFPLLPLPRIRVGRIMMFSLHG